MKLNIYFILLAFAFSSNAIFAQDNQTQTTQTTKPERLSHYEIGAQFTSLGSDFSRRDGFGGRFTFNLNRNVALEAEGNLLSIRRFDGRVGQGLFGVKAGKRYDKFGIFGKARPGLIYNSRGISEYVLQNNVGSANPFSLGFRTKSQTSFALDVGGVVEFYPTKHLVTRFDFGDIIIVTPSRNTFNTASFRNGIPTLIPSRLPTMTTNNFQFSAGVGYRF